MKRNFLTIAAVSAAIAAVVMLGTLNARDAKPTKTDRTSKTPTSPAASRPIQDIPSDVDEALFSQQEIRQARIVAELYVKLFYIKPSRDSLRLMKQITSSGFFQESRDQMLAWQPPDWFVYEPLKIERITLDPLNHSTLSVLVMATRRVTHLGPDGLPIRKFQERIDTVLGLLRRPDLPIGWQVVSIQ